MCISALDLSRAALAMAASYDPATRQRAALALELERLGQAQRAIEAMVVAGVARLASCGSPGTQRQTLDELARKSGSSLGRVKDQLVAGQAMAANADIDAAARSGRLSPAQLGLVAAVNADSPADASALATMAQGTSFRQLSNEAARMAACRPDGPERHRALHAQRYLKHWTGPDGAWQLRARGTPEAGAAIMAAIDAAADKVYAAVPGTEPHESPEAYRFDGLATLARGQSSAKIGTEVLVRVDYDCLVRGYALKGEVCEVTGFGPISPEALAELVDSGDPVLRAVVTRGEEVVGVAHIGRKPSRAQMTALHWLYPTCAYQSCSTPACWLQSDHRADWAKTHYTVFDLLDRLCPRHHRMKTYQGWRLVTGRGRRAFVPPEDSRHPGFGPEQGIELRFKQPRPKRLQMGPAP